MSSLILICICLLSGVLLRYFREVPDQAHVALNKYVIWIAIPSMALAYIPKIDLTWELLFPFLTAWIIFLFSWIFFGVMGKLLQWPRKITGALILTAGLGNTAFVGFPLIEALFGQEGLKTAIIIDQPGTFLVVSTLGVVVAALYSGKDAKPSAIARKVILFPPFIGFFVAIFLNILHVQLPIGIQDAILPLAKTITPVALVSVGMQLKPESNSRYWSFLALGLGFKLIFAPLLIFFLYMIVFKQSGNTAIICVLEAAMAPMVTAAIVASTYGLKPRFSSLILSVGIPISLVTVMIWYYLLT